MKNNKRCPNCYRSENILNDIYEVLFQLPEIKCLITNSRSIDIWNRRIDGYEENIFSFKITVDFNGEQIDIDSGRLYTQTQKHDQLNNDHVK